MANSQFINPETETVESWDWDGKIESLVGKLNCKYFEIIRLTTDADLYVDDEGAINGGTLSFGIQTYPALIMGRGVVLGRNNHGDTIASPLDLETVKNMVCFDGSVEYDKKYDPFT